MERLQNQVTSGGATRTLGFNYDNTTGNFNAAGKTSSVAGDLNVTNFAYATAGKPHRLTSVQIGSVSNTLTYDSNGNITRYDAAGANKDTWLDYDARNNVTRITVGTDTGNANDKNTATPQARDEFWYDPDGNRFLRRASWDAAGVQKQAHTIYLGEYEEARTEVGNPYSVIQRYAFSDTIRFERLTAASGGAISTNLNFVHRDHLGSVDAVTTGSGALFSRTSFDPFGARRESNWSSDATSTTMSNILGQWYEFAYFRGFTDHEQLDRTGFVHMNGRVYDTRIGRFVSPDPIVGDPTFSQSYNRYAYVENSPLSYTDPSGFQTSGYCNDAFGGGSCLGANAFIGFYGERGYGFTDILGMLLGQQQTLTSPSQLIYEGPSTANAGPTLDQPFIPAGDGVLERSAIGVPCFCPGSPLNDRLAHNIFVQGPNNFRDNLNLLGALVLVYVVGPHLPTIMNAENDGADSGKEPPVPGATPGEKTKGRTSQWEAGGGMEQADKDFDAKGPVDVIPLPGGGRRGTLPDGREINVRPTSTDGRPTLEIQSGKNRIKVRYSS
jgi:RHS repeat-associated protein